VTKSLTCGAAVRCSTVAQHGQTHADTYQFNMVNLNPHTSPRKCNDIIFVLLFLGVTIATLYYSIRGIDELSNYNFCNQIVPAHNVQPSADILYLYDNCLTYIVQGSPFSSVQCETLAVQAIAQNINITNLPSLMKYDNTQSNQFSLLSLAADDANSKKLFELSSVSNLPSPAQLVWNNCLSYIIQRSSDANNRCLSFAMQTVLNNSYSSCISNSNIKSCAVNTLSYIPTPANVHVPAQQYQYIYNNCTLSIQNRDQVINCFESKLTPYIGAAQSAAVTEQCILSAVYSEPLALQNCVHYTVQVKLPTDSPRANLLFSNCLQPIMQGDESAARQCAQFILEDQLHFSATLQLFLKGVQQIIGQEKSSLLQITSSTGSPSSGTCLSSLLISPLSSLDCLLAALNSFQGLEGRVCVDLSNRATDQFHSFYSGFVSYFETYSRQLIACFLSIIALGIGLAMSWVLIVAQYAKKLIIWAISFTIIQLLVLAGINFAIGDIPAAAILLAYAVFKFFWYLFFRHSFLFAATILKLSVQAISGNISCILVAMFLFTLKGIWCILVVGAYFHVRNSQYGQALVVLSFFWSLEILTNMLAVTVSYIIAAWYYQDNEKKHSTTWSTLKGLIIALTYSFGSICCGSLIVALLATARYFLRKAKQTKRKWLKALIYCFLSCMQIIVETFNRFAFVSVAAGGLNYYSSAKSTFTMLRKSGLAAITNDSIVYSVMNTGEMCGCLAVAGLAGILAHQQYHLPGDLIAFVICLGLWFGYELMAMATVIIEISCATLFVCFAENPYQLAKSQPELHKQLIEAWERKHKYLPDFMKSPEVYNTNNNNEDKSPNENVISPSAIVIETKLDKQENATNEPISPVSITAEELLTWLNSDSNSNVRLHPLKWYKNSKTKLKLIMKPKDEGYWDSRGKSKQVVDQDEEENFNENVPILIYRDSNYISMSSVLEVRIGMRNDVTINSNLYQNNAANLNRFVTIITQEKQLDFELESAEKAATLAGGLAEIMYSASQQSENSSFDYLCGRLSKESRIWRFLQYVKNSHSLLSIFFVHFRDHLPRYGRLFIYLFVTLFNLMLVLAFAQTSLTDIQQVICILFILPCVRILITYILKSYGFKAKNEKFRMIYVLIIMIVTMAGVIAGTIALSEQLPATISASSSAAKFFISWTIGLFVEVIILFALFFGLGRCCPCTKLIFDDGEIARDDKHKSNKKEPKSPNKK
jgi:hypothetical protein